MAGESNSRKLMVEICNARNLMPKDGQGTASAYVMVDYDGQRRRTRTVSKDLNPKWDERLDFAVLQDSAAMAAETLEINIYNDKAAAAGGRRSNFLGRVKIAGSAFSPAGSEAMIYYPLEKRSVFSQVKGEIGIKVWYEDPAPAPEADGEKKAEASSTPAKEGEQEKSAESEPKADEEKKTEPEKPAEEGEKKESESEKKSEEAKKEEAPAAETPQPPPPPPPQEEIPAIAQQAEKKPKEEIITTSNKISSDLDLRSGHGAYDLVDRMPFLYVRVVKAKRPTPDPDSSIFAKLLIGTHTVKTTKSQADNRDWDQVFAFDKEGLNSTSLEVSVWTEKQEEIKEEADNSTTTTTVTTESCLGTVSFDLQEVPKRVPPDSPLAPQWYTLEGSAEKTGPLTDVMVAVWIGTQADEAFQEAWQSDSGGLIPETRSKVYLSPKLWYLRLTVIQTQDLQIVGSTAAAAAASPRAFQAGELYVKAQLGAQIFKTSRTTAGPASTSSSGPTWNEDLIFVAAEPFEPFLVITVEDVAAGKPVGHAKVNVASIDKRTDDRADPKSRWFNLVGHGDDAPYAGRIHVSVCLEGGYHVLDEAAHVTSDVQPSAKQLTKPPVGLLEVGIRGASNLLPVKTKDGTRGTTDAYVVAKYGPKWVRTRTILDRFNPRWNEQYTWDIYDPCTVLTIGVFDNGRYYKPEDSGSGKPGRDARIGKVRIRLSTLETNRAYFSKHALTVLLPGGAKRMGEIEIGIRFTCSSWISLLQAYSSPVLPRMHYVCPMGRAQQDILRQTAMRIVTARMARSEPALGQEVVQLMLDTDTHVFSMRKSKVNWFRVAGGLSKVASLARWVDEVRTWTHPSTTVLVHLALLAVVLCPSLVLPTVFMYAFLILALRVRYRQRIPLSMDPRLSCLDSVGPDELDEEFDGFPSVRSAEVIRIRYDRLRALAGRAQSFLGDMAAQWERVEALYNWKDPRATGIFVVVCLLASLVFYVVPFKAFAIGFGFYYLRHPRFRGDMPSVPANFFRRLPSLSDQIL